jgi:ubiquinol-cytochrome c reductase cytochrome b subunit
MRRIVDWVEHRTGIESAIRNFLYEEIPASSGWRHVLGSMALFSFLVQAFTGILLAFNYAPTPGDAYNSVRYIVSELTAGRLMRGLHHWGASMMVIVVVLHMTQVFVWGAYKKPREVTWIFGCVLLVITLAFGLTGYLLPWDQRAYWGTVVATQIAGSVPVVGPYVSRLLGSDGGIGVVTFARFFGLHVLILPPVMAMVIVFHVYLVRKHGVAPEPGETSRTKFFPRQVYRDTVAIFIAFAILFTTAAAVRVPLERLADPTDTSYIPRPEWYFLFLFQTLRLFEGRLELVGSFVLPNLAIVLLFLVPFLDRGKVVRASQRFAAIGVVALGFAGWGALTLTAALNTPTKVETEALNEGPQTWQELSPEELAGIGYFRTENCASCHPAGRTGVGPDLTKTAIKRNAAWMIEHFKRPQQLVPGTSMPAIQLSDPQLNALAAFLLKLNPKNSEALHSAPQFAVDGAMVYQRYRCSACHKINGVGMQVGPPLNGLAARRNAAWISEHFANPQKVSPGTVMPPYRFAPNDLDAITKYLLGLPKPAV